MKDDYIIDQATGYLVYTSTESVLSGPEKRLMRLAAGYAPENEADKKLQKQVQEIEASGRILEIPSM